MLRTPSIVMAIATAATLAGCTAAEEAQTAETTSEQPSSSVEQSDEPVIGMAADDYSAAVDGAVVEGQPEYLNELGPDPIEGFTRQFPTGTQGEAALDAVAAENLPEGAEQTEAFPDGECPDWYFDAPGVGLVRVGFAPPLGDELPFTQVQVWPGEPTDISC